MFRQPASISPELVEDMGTDTMYILTPVPAGKNGAGFSETGLISANFKNFIQQQLSPIMAMVKQQILHFCCVNFTTADDLFYHNQTGTGTQRTDSLLVANNRRETFKPAVGFDSQYESLLLLT